MARRMKLPLRNAAMYSGTQMAMPMATPRACPARLSFALVE
jgi:hypothetical protein